VQFNDWLAATLSVLTIALTILGVLIALVAVWGYRGIKDEAKDIAGRTAKATISEYLDSEAIPNKLREEIRIRVADEADYIVAAFMPLAQAPSAAPDAEPGAVAESYPEEGGEPREPH